MDSGVGRRNDDGSPAVASTSNLQAQTTATSQDFAARLNALRNGWQESTGQSTSSNVQTQQNPAQATIPRSMHVDTPPTTHIVPSQWSSVPPSPSRAPIPPRNPSVLASPPIPRTQASSSTSTHTASGQQQIANVPQIVPPIGSARNNTEIWRRALQMNPDERQIFLEAEMRKLAESSPNPPTIPIARRTETSVPAQGQASSSINGVRVQSQWRPANQVVQQQEVRATPVQQQQQRFQAMVAGAGGGQQLLRLQPTAATTGIHQQPTPTQQALPNPNSNQTTLVRQRAPTQSVPRASASPIQPPQAPATVTSNAAPLSSDAAHAVIQRLMPRGFVNEPRFVPRHVRHFSRTYQDEVRRYAVPPESTPTASTSAQVPDDTYEKLKVKTDATPVPRLLEEAASGIGRLAGLLPATDLLDREAHSTQYAIITLVNALRETEGNVMTVTRKNRELEEQIVALRKDMNLYKPVFEAVLQGLQRPSRSGSSTPLNPLRIEQGSNSESVVQGKRPQMQEASAQTSTAAIAAAATTTAAAAVSSQSQDAVATTAASQKSKEVNGQTSEEAKGNTSASVIDTKQQSTSNGAIIPTIPPVEAPMTNGASSTHTPPSEAAPEQNATNNMEEDVDMQIDEEIAGDAEVAVETKPSPKVKGEEGEDTDQLLSPERAIQQRVSKSREPESQGTPSRTLRSASQKANTPMKNGSPANKKRKRSMRSSFQIHKGNKVECINLDSSDEETDEE